jgi:hypothetical protein
VMVTIIFLKNIEGDSSPNTTQIAKKVCTVEIFYETSAAGGAKEPPRPANNDATNGQRQRATADCMTARAPPRDHWKRPKKE